jgi:hypothetical protein
MASTSVHTKSSLGNQDGKIAGSSNAHNNPAEELHKLFAIGLSNWSVTLKL